MYGAHRRSLTGSFSGREHRQHGEWPHQENLHRSIVWYCYQPHWHVLLVAKMPSCTVTSHTSSKTYPPIVAQSCQSVAVVDAKLGNPSISEGHQPMTGKMMCNGTPCQPIATMAPPDVLTICDNLRAWWPWVRMRCVAMTSSSFPGSTVVGSEFWGSWCI